MASTISGSDDAANCRQGVEITGFAQVFASALPRMLSNASSVLISEGRPIIDQNFFDESITTQISSKKLHLAPNHRIEKRDLGIPKTHYDDLPFEEIPKLDPVTYVGDENFDLRYPIVLDAVSPIDPGQLDGVLEPFSIRGTATRTNIESPFESRRVRGNITNYAEDIFGKSTPIEQVVYYEGFQGQTRAFQEHGDDLERPIDLKFNYFPEDPVLSVPFLDTNDAALVASRISDDSFVTILEMATGSYQKFGSTFRSSRTGFTYNNTENGTDSITYFDRLSVSSSATPYDRRQRILRRSSPVNIGFYDADTVSKTSPFNGNRVIEGNQTYFPGNSSIYPGSFDVTRLQDISVLASPVIIQRDIIPMPDVINNQAFKEYVSKEDMLLPDGTYAKAFIPIDISSEADWDPAHKVYNVRSDVYDFRDSVIAHFNFETAASPLSLANVTDKSGNNHTAVLTSNASVDLDWSPGPITTRGSLNCESSSGTDGVVITNPVSADFDLALGEGFSVSCWIKATSVGGMQTFVIKDNASPNFDYLLGSVGNTIRFTVSGSGGGNIYVEDTSNFTAGKWHHVTAVYGGGGLTSLGLSVNGMSATSFTASGTFTTPRNDSSSNVYVGRRYSGTEHLIGRMSSVEFYNRALSSSERGAVYSLQLVGCQYMGRVDSRMTARTTTANWLGGSMFLSSAFRNVSSSFDRYNGLVTGVAGTGFYYYSPFYKRWVEKRSDHATSFSNSRYWTGEGLNTLEKDNLDARNSIEVNSRQVFATPPGLPAPGAFDTARVLSSNDYYVSAKMSITGTNEILAQFTASPQLGYLLPYKELLESSGYGSIGTPTITFGAPNSPKYHAFDEETIKMSDYIDRPFLLRKMIIRVPVELQRRHDIVTSSYTVGGGNPLYSKNVTARKDLDNYSFFLYRQRRKEKFRDTVSDISSSVRFLIASSSVCVYNSSSFGQAQFDSFYFNFGNSTPVSQSNPSGIFTSSYLDSLVSYMTGNNADPITLQSLTRWSSPLHSPSFAIDAGLSASFTPGYYPIERFLGQGKLRLVSYPSVVLGGYPNSSLMYVTSSTGHLSTSFFTSLIVDDNELFNRYPYTGSFSSQSSSLVPPITTIVQHFWFGGTRQPVISTTSIPLVTLTGSESTSVFKPYVQSNGTETEFISSESVKFLKTYTDPTFDVELGRVGLSLFDDKSNVFESPFDISVDGRSIPITLGKNAKPKMAGVIQRSNLINFKERTDETNNGYDSQFTIGHLSGANMADLISSVTVGYAPVSKNTSERILRRDYILLPADELILGLDAGVTPAPDITPMSGSPRPDRDFAHEQLPPASPLFTNNELFGVSQFVGPGVAGTGVQSLPPGRGFGQPIFHTVPGGGLQPNIYEPFIEKMSSDNNKSSSTSNGELGTGGTSLITSMGSPIDEFNKSFNITGYSGLRRGHFWRDFMSYIDLVKGTPAPYSRPKFTPFVTSIMKETLAQYGGNSYIRILHGEAEIILFGEYVSDGVGRQMTRNSFSDDMSQIVGDGLIVDQFDVAESDALYQSYLADVITGSMLLGTRGVSYDSSIRTSVSGSNVKRFVKMTSDSIVLHDLFFSGVNESPTSAFRNAPKTSNYATNPLQFVLGGVSIATGSIFRGQIALKRKPVINISAQFNTNHHGYISDLVQGVENTKTYNLENPSGKSIVSGPIRVRFMSGSVSVEPITTSCQNVSKTGTVDTPYLDGHSNSRDDDLVEII